MLVPLESSLFRHATKQGTSFKNQEEILALGPSRARRREQRLALFWNGQANQSQTNQFWVPISLQVAKFVQMGESFEGKPSSRAAHFELEGRVLAKPGKLTQKKDMGQLAMTYKNAARKALSRFFLGREQDLAYRGCVVPRMQVPFKWVHVLFRLVNLFFFTQIRRLSSLVGF